MHLLQLVAVITTLAFVHATDDDASVVVALRGAGEAHNMNSETTSVQHQQEESGRDLATWQIPSTISQRDCAAHSNMDSQTCAMLNAQCMKKYNIGLSWVGNGCSALERDQSCPKVPPGVKDTCRTVGDGGCQCTYNALNVKYQYCNFKCPQECHKRAFCRWNAGPLGGCTTWNGVKYIPPPVCPTK